MTRAPMFATIVTASVVVAVLCHCQRSSGPVAAHPAAAGAADAAPPAADAPQKTPEQTEPPSPAMEENDLGVESYSAKRYPDAIRHLQRAIELDSQNDTAHFNIGQVYLAIENYHQAYEHFLRAIELDGTQASYHYKAGFAAHELGNLQTSETHLLRAIELDPAAHLAHFRLGRVLEGLDRAEAAARRYTKAIHLQPRFMAGYRDLGTLYANHEFYDQAVQVFEQGLLAAEKCSPGATELEHRLGTVRLDQLRYKAAATHFEQALACDPTQADTLFSAGWARALMGDRLQARELLRRFIKLAESDDSVRPDYVMAAQQKLDRLAEE